MRQCPKCGENVGRLSRHFARKHPEYKWSREIRKGNTSRHYYCGLCGKTVEGFGDLTKHYQEYHDSELQPPQQLSSVAKPISDVEQGNLTVSALDRLLEQVNINTGLLKEEQKRNRELIERCTSYASRIVELQNQLAQDTTRRY